MELSKEARELIRQQVGEWDLAARNYKSLDEVKVKSFDFGDYRISVQFNPARIVSSAAKVDALSIEARPCFLCQKNLPAVQRGLRFDDHYLILVNPFPIFPEHLTIPHQAHTDQRIAGNFESMLGLAAGLTDFVIFYNGPKCGASAPDHLHFQAGLKGFLQIEEDFSKHNCCRKVRSEDAVTIYHWPGYQRGVITLKSSDKTALASIFNQIYNKLHIMQPDQAEPLLNILASFDRDEWLVHIFPRILHRPAQYFETGDRQILLSPASVDMGGVLITPRREDFMRISAPDITDIFSQVCMDAESVRMLIDQL